MVVGFESTTTTQGNDMMNTTIDKTEQLQVMLRNLTCNLASIQATDITVEQGKLIREAMRTASRASVMVKTMQTDDDSDA